MKSNKASTCILCDTSLTEANDSDEHVIPDAIGGRKTVRGFICVECNSRTGSEWDADLSRQMKHMSLLFGVQRSRGIVRHSVVSTQSGREVLYHHDGTMTPRHPSYSETPHEGGVNIRIGARSMKEARKMLKDIARKYPKLDVEAAIAQARKKQVPMDEPLNFSAPQGGISFWRSSVKSMLALMSLVNRDSIGCEHACAFLRSQDQEPCVGYYYERDVVQDRPDGVPLHIVHVEGRDGVIVGYIEYFGFFRAVSLLSSSYEGDAFEATYAVDPRSGETLSLKVEFELTKAEILEAYDWKKYDADTLRDAMASVIGPAVKAANNAAMSRLIDTAIAQAMEECGIKEGAEATDDQYQCFSSKVSSLIATELVKRQMIR